MWGTFSQHRVVFVNQRSGVPPCSEGFPRSASSRRCVDPKIATQTRAATHAQKRASGERARARAPRQNKARAAPLRLLRGVPPPGIPVRRRNAEAAAPRVRTASRQEVSFCGLTVCFRVSGSEEYSIGTKRRSVCEWSDGKRPPVVDGGWQAGGNGLGFPLAVCGSPLTLDRRVLRGGTVSPLGAARPPVDPRVIPGTTATLPLLLLLLGVLLWPRTRRAPWPRPSGRTGLQRL